MTTPNLTLTVLVSLALAACGGKGNTSDSDDSTGAGGQSSTSAGPTTGDETSTTGQPTTSGTDPGGTATSIGSQTDSDPTTGEAPTTGAATTGDATSTGATTTTTTTATSEGSDDTGLLPPGDAIVNRECAPNDGPALEFRVDVSEPVCGAGWDGDQLRILLFQGAPLGEGVHMLDGGNGFASLQIGMDEPLIANKGSVTITTWSDELVVGTYSLTFSDNSEREGGFSGPFCMTNPMCG